MKKIMALALALCLLLTGCGTRLDKTSPLKKLDDDSLAAALEQAARAGYDVLGTEMLSVGVLRDGRVRFYYFGGATEDTIYELGLLTQLFTGISMLSYLDLDEPAEDYFGGVVDLPDWNGAEITVRQLATQTAGLPDWPDNLPARGVYRDAAFLTYLSQTALLYEPGTEARDSVSSVALLGNLMEWSVGGAAVRDVNLLNTRVMRRVKMYATVAEVTEARQSLMAAGHEADGGKPPVRDYDPEYSSMGCATAFYSTAYDMMLFAAACMDQISSDDGASPTLPELAEQAFSRQYSDEDGGRGFGCRVDDLGFGDVAWQSSVLGGFGGYFALCPDAGTAVVLLGDTAVSMEELGTTLISTLSQGLSAE